MNKIYLFLMILLIFCANSINCVIKRTDKDNQPKKFDKEEESSFLEKSPKISKILEN